MTAFVTRRWSLRAREHAFAVSVRSPPSLPPAPSPLAARRQIEAPPIPPPRDPFRPSPRRLGRNLMERLLATLGGNKRRHGLRVVSRFPAARRRCASRTSARAGELHQELPRHSGDVRVRHRLPSGARRSVLARARGVLHLRRVRRRVHAEPHVRGDVLGRTGHTEAVQVAWDREGVLRGPVRHALDLPRPHAGQPPGQRRRHAVPLRHLLLHGEAGDRRARVRGGARRRSGDKSSHPRNRNHHAVPPAGQLRVLLRRGLPPAVPRQARRALPTARRSPCVPVPTAFLEANGAKLSAGYWVQT